MGFRNDLNWWAFAIDAETREGGEIKLRGDMEINPPLQPGGLHLLNYHDYIEVGNLLSCQAPSTVIPDERIFIISHQMFELAFKQMIFDCAVTAKTFEALLSKDDEGLSSLCLSPTTDKEKELFWRPALTASGRLKYSSGEVMPRLLTFLAPTGVAGDESVELFHPEEFKKFRQFLAPASGFQTAQFRLIQRALGKSSLLAVRLFPGQKFQKCYLGENKVDNLPVSLVDELVLRNGYVWANPPQGSTPALAARLDDLAHEVLIRLSAVHVAARSREITLVPDEEAELERMAKQFGDMLAQLQALDGGEEADLREAVATFERTWRESLRVENARRKSLGAARLAAARLVTPPGDASFLATVLNHLVDTDKNLHGSEDETGRVIGGFLNYHRRVAGRQIADDPNAVGGGTSGGGTPYLRFSVERLFQLFPALVAYADLRTSRQASFRVEEAKAEV